MRKRFFGIALSSLPFALCPVGALLFALCVVAEAQEASKVYRIGFLSTDPLPADRWDALLDGLRERGYIEGRNFVFERRFSEGNAKRFPEFAAEMVRLRVDIIIVTTTPAAIAAKNASQTIPIVMTTANDPVGAGLVASLAWPGGNITGLSTLAPELHGKRLELLKEVVPGMNRVAIFWNAANPANASVWKETQAAARALARQLQSQEVRGSQDLEDAFALTAKARPDALLVLSDALIIMHRQRIVDFVTRKHFPSVFGSTTWVVAGGLMSYGPTILDRYRRAATYWTRSSKAPNPLTCP